MAEVSAGVMFVGWGWIDRDSCAVARSQRQQAVVVADQRDRSGGELGRKRPVLGTSAHDVERWLIESGQP